MAKPAIAPPAGPGDDRPAMNAVAWCCSGAPALDDDLLLGKAAKDLPIEQLVPEFRVEVLAVAVLSGATRPDIGGLCADGGDPVPYSFGDVLRAVVRPYVIRHAAQDEQIRQDFDDVGRS